MTSREPSIHRTYRLQQLDEQQRRLRERIRRGTIDNDLHTMESQIDPEIDLDRAVRFKVTDTCRFACTYCHNEGTQVSGKTTSLTLMRNALPLNTTTQPGFYTLDAEPGPELTSVLQFLSQECGMREVHLTGGQPDRNKNLVKIVEAISEAGMVAKMTSNGERGTKGIRDLGNAGLAAINFSLHGLTVEELARTQHPNYPRKLLEANLAALHAAMNETLACGIKAKANLVVTPESGEERVETALRVLDERIDLRLQPELKQQQEGLFVIRSLLVAHRAYPLRRVISTGSSNESVQYEFSNFSDERRRSIWVKYFRRSRLPRDDACNGCAIDAKGECDEGYYGPKLYYTDRGYMIGSCILRMELNRTHADMAAEHARDPRRSLATAMRNQPLNDARNVVSDGTRVKWPTYEEDIAFARQEV